jgi:hypothetical protein
VGERILGYPTPTVVKEVDFLKSIIPAEEEGSEEEATGDSVGRIDTVLVRPGVSPLQWCALELQAVYFSGDEMGPEYKVVAETPIGQFPFPVGRRRPDFRSSGPKRLMPQLQIKVPTLRRWGKKMAVVVDKPFFNSLGPMDRIDHLSNADIAWFVVAFSDTGGDFAQMNLDEVFFTTLESAIEGLTAGTPVPLEEFESDLATRLHDPKRKRNGTVITLDK